MRKSILVALLAGALMLVAVPAGATPGADNPGRPGTEVSVFVTGQGLTYDSIVKTNLPGGHGPFQQLHMTDDGLQTEFGPGDPGYLGGRWWVDANGNGEQDAGDVYFICPLLGPGT